MQVGDLLTRHFGSGDPKRAKPHAIRKIRSNLLSEAKKGKIRQPSSYTQLEKSVLIKKIRFIRFPFSLLSEAKKKNPKPVFPSLF